MANGPIKCKFSVPDPQKMKFKNKGFSDFISQQKNKNKTELFWQHAFG
jgi:hypothetical protein